MKHFWCVALWTPLNTLPRPFAYTNTEFFFSRVCTHFGVRFLLFLNFLVFFFLSLRYFFALIRLISLVGVLVFQSYFNGIVVSNVKLVHTAPNTFPIKRSFWYRNFIASTVLCTWLVCLFFFSLKFPIFMCF